MAKKALRGLIFAFLAILLRSAPVAAQASDIAVVVNPDNPVTNISVVDLRKIFNGEKSSWPNGIRVKLIVRPPGSVERQALLRLLRMSQNEYTQYWTGRVYRGEADSEPITLPSIGMVIEAMKVFPGAIAFVDSAYPKPGMPMKIVRIAGHLPGEEGYPLR
jgi:ABC-type phosphate transport system substrate-binding protein